MPWKQTSSWEERTQLVLAIKRGEQSVAQLSRRFQISRKTAWKWWRRYQAGGVAALEDRSHRTHCGPRRMTPGWQQRLRAARESHPRWGARKLQALLRQRYGPRGLPAVSTLSYWLRRLGLIGARKVRARRGPQLPACTLTVPGAANEVWTIDFKGWMRTADGVRCEPLTVRDLFSRYVLGIVLLLNQSDLAVRAAMSRLFARYGLPKVIRVDNGAPFGGCGALGLSRLSVWWLRLGIRVEFIRPAHPQDNGAHEQMHRELKADTMCTLAANPRALQARWHWWRKYYNHERPHEALGQKPPGRFYRPSRRAFTAVLRAPAYPPDFAVRRVFGKGIIRWQSRARPIGRAFVGELLGLCAISAEVTEIYLESHLIGTLHASDPGGMRPASRTLPAKAQTVTHPLAQNRHPST